MPDQEISHLEQPAVCWHFSMYDGVRGQPIVFPGVDMNVRWKFSRTEMQDPKRNTITVDATVVVAEEVKVDSLMWPGSTDWLVGTAGPTDRTSGISQDVYVVKAYYFTPDVKNRAATRTLGLLRYKAKLPEQVGQFFAKLNACGQ